MAAECLANDVAKLETAAKRGFIGRKAKTRATAGATATSVSHLCLGAGFPKQPPSVTGFTVRSNLYLVGSYLQDYVMAEQLTGVRCSMAGALGRRARGGNGARRR